MYLQGRRHQVSIHMRHAVIGRSEPLGLILRMVFDLPGRSENQNIFGQMLAVRILGQLITEVGHDGNIQ